MGGCAVNGCGKNVQLFCRTFFRAGAIGGWVTLEAGVTIRPFDAVSMELDLQYRDRNGYSTKAGAILADFMRANGSRADVNWFIAPGHQIRWNLQWAGVRAVEDGFYEIPDDDGERADAARAQAS